MLNVLINKAALTVRWLMKSTSEEKSISRLILCTGERMQRTVLKLYRAVGLRTTTYEPVHARGLSNEFMCYANFESSNWGWKEEPAEEAGL
jgi:putative N6-adenine methyltransferase